ncbi:MAG: ATP-dependent zinc metalloprotease FtsH [Sphaerochaetaceae bacterium]|jgi:cell division protease FtsH|nr:ATP-dependent zinc metalloprotease FtsH [Sphaerochaetaceae bacterium]HHU88559.1 ATP-dependent zinc metalloprotease FtsH [Spirochaetales bacterium]
MEEREHEYECKDEKTGKKKPCPENEPGIHRESGRFTIFGKRFKFSFWYFLIILIVMYLINSFFVTTDRATAVEYNLFKEMVSSGEIERVEIQSDYYIGYSKSREKVQQGDTSPVYTFSTYIINDPAFIPLLDEKGVEYYAVAPKQPSIFSTLLGYVAPLLIFFLIWRFVFSRMGQSGGQGVLSFNQNKAKIVAEGDTGIRFKDVAGVDESKAELEEVVDFLQNPTKYSEIGGKIPKGVLLVGPPGTGKTLLAKAVAGEAEVPFFRMSGADFVEMFVGVGAARVRDLFRQARENSPCIIFIDEIDAIGRSRSGAGFGGNDEREQTLNQLLVEMDGFDSRTGVIILAATNRPEILDPALLRPGRFDRQVLVDKPDLDGRLAILQIHTRDIKMEDDVDLKKVAQAAAGLAGADLANIANEAALLAVRSNRKKVTQEDFDEAIEKSVAGLQRKSRILNEEERKKVAYHEVGHALTAHMTKGAPPVSKISIIPRGLGALGYTLQLPIEDRFLMSESELLGNIDTLLGGRAAEELIFGEISTGAGNDISRASDLVRRMITEYGMSEKYRNITLPSTTSQGLGGAREYSEVAQEYIDNETARVVNERYALVLEQLKANQGLLEKITEILLDKESIGGDEFKELAQSVVVA